MMRKTYRLLQVLAIQAGVIAMLLGPPSAQAVPSYARQTGITCAACHTVYPQLTAFGRSFKLNGYTLTNIKQVAAPSSPVEPGLSLNNVLPISLVLQTSMTHVKKLQAGADHQNPDVNFPQELGLYLAGEITKHLGTFLQFTYSQDSDKFEMDMTDIRFANSTQVNGKNLSYGISVNNGPSMGDLWNTTPGFGWPFIGSDSAGDMVPQPSAEPFLGSMLVMMNSLGVGPYAMWNNHLYGALQFYRSAKIMGGGNVGTSNAALVGAAPYWRLAWADDSANSSWEVGTFGFHGKWHNPMKMGGGNWSGNDTYTDTAVDAQYQRFSGPYIWELRGRYIHEKQKLNATDSADPSHHANFLSINGDWYYQRTYGFSLGYNRISGDSLTAWNMMPSAQKADSSYVTVQADWLPWLNTKFSVQYVAYNKIDGSTTNASDSNTLYLDMMLAY